jgi:FAD/FMN-containing dehydrogenase
MSLAQSSPLATLPADVSHHLQNLRARLEGDVLTPGQAAYDLARRTVSLRSDQRPVAIVRALCPADVAAAVLFAHEHDLLLAVRSGGHSIALLSVVDDALVVDLSLMKRIDIDPTTRTARVEPGVTSGDLAGPAHEHGLALSTGDTQSVGMGGLTTGGGIGYLVRKHGLTSDNLLAARVVTATGDIVTASPTEHPDLFWAIRGGGGNMGVVVEFTYRLAPVSHILGGLLVLPATREVIRGYLDYSIAAPDELTTLADLTKAPPEPSMPQEWVGQPVLMILTAWSGSVEDGERALAPLRALAEPVADLVSWMPYPSIYEFTAHLAEPHGASIRMMFADDLSDEAIDAMLAATESGTSPANLVHLRGLGGAFGRVPNDATAFAHRDRRYFVAVIAVWLDPTDDPDPHEQWTIALWDRLRPEGRGVYVNFLEKEGAERVREAYPAHTYERLSAIKRRYDPDNLFRLNQNVPPAS